MDLSFLIPSTFVNVIAGVLSVIIITILFVMRNAHFVTTDQLLELQPFVPKKNDSSSSVFAWIDTGMYIRDFLRFDATQNSFIVDLILWFEFDPIEISFAIVDNFYFEKGMILQKTMLEPIKKKNKLFIHYNLRVQFSSNLDYKDFPFDNHRIVLSLINGGAESSETMFEVKKSAFVFNGSIYTASWKYEDHVVYKGYSQAKLAEGDCDRTILSPQVQMIMDFWGGWRKIFVILVPLYLLSFVGAFALVIVDKQMTLSLGSISGLLAHRFIVETMSPSVGYFTISDSLYVILLIFSFVFFLINVCTLILGQNLLELKSLILLLSLISWTVITYFITRKR